VYNPTANGDASGYDIVPGRVELAPHNCEVTFAPFKKLQLKEWQGDLRIDIRVWSGYPTRKGVSLSPLRWKMLCLNVEEIENAVFENKAKTLHLGGPFFVYVDPTYKRIHLRCYWLPAGEEKEVPTKRGITLTLQDWRGLVKTMDDVRNRIPNYNELKPCFSKDDHLNQTSALQCSECNPFHFCDW
jgi:hypothetical protein